MAVQVPVKDKVAGSNPAAGASWHLIYQNILVIIRKRRWAVMDNNKVILIALVVIFAFVVLGALSKPLGLATENSRYFFGFGGMILGYAIGKMKVNKK